jgi:hypothetical protein
VSSWGRDQALACMNVDTAFAVLHYFVGLDHHSLHSESLAKVLIIDSKKLSLFHAVLSDCAALVVAKKRLIASHTTSFDTFTPSSEDKIKNYLKEFLVFGAS